MPLPSVREWLEILGQFYQHYGYFTVFLGTLGENTAFLGFFLPGNSLALLGALYARLGTLAPGRTIALGAQISEKARWKGDPSLTPYRASSLFCGYERRYDRYELPSFPSLRIDSSNGVEYSLLLARLLSCGRN